MRSLIGAMVLWAVLVSGASAAPVEAINFAAPTVDFTNGQWSLGFQFQTGAQPIRVTHLGFYDSGLNGLTQSHDVGIYSAGGTLLTSGTVTNASTLSGFFRYVDIADFDLAANTNYYIAAATLDENYTWDPTGLVVDPRITFLNDAFILSNVLAFPNGGSNGGGLQGWFGPNFLLVNTPEPASLLAWGLISGVGLLGYRLRRRKTAA